MLKKLHKTLRPEKEEGFKDLENLRKIPKKETPLEMPTYMDFKEGFTSQADVLHMPMAKYGYDKILVVVDNHTKKFDGEPMKNEDSISIVKAMTKIFNRDIVKMPKIFQFDDGSGFHGDVIDYCKKNNIHYRYAPTNRHRSQAIVEAKNKILVWHYIVL